MTRYAISTNDDPVWFKKRGRPPVDTVPITVRLPESYIVALNGAIGREGDRHTRAQAVRFILRDWLTMRGLLDEKGGTGEASETRNP